MLHHPLSLLLQIKKLSVKVKKWKKRQALGLPRGGRPRKPKMINDDEEEEEEVEMSEELSDPEEYMEYSIVQHEVTSLLITMGIYILITMVTCLLITMVTT